MKIPQPLPQFEENKTLIVATGDKLAEFYVAFSGMLEKAGEFEFSGPTFSDREGFFISSSHGGILAAGAVYENLEPYVDKKFLKGLSQKIKDLVGSERIDEMYIFTPDYMKDLVFDSLPKGAQKLVRRRLVGNYTKKHPLDIIKRIKREEDKRAKDGPPKNIEARRILEKSVKARRIIKGKAK